MTKSERKKEITVLSYALFYTLVVSYFFLVALDMPLMVMSPSNYRREIVITLISFFNISLFHNTSFLIVGLIEANLQASRYCLL